MLKIKKENERVHEIRTTLNLTLEKFGKRLGVTKVAISNIEKGHRNVTEQMRKAICREYNINETWLTSGNGEMFIIDESKKALNHSTGFRDYLESLGYIIGESEYTDCQMHILETNSYIHLDSDDMKIINELENDTERDIRRTISLLIAAKTK